MKYTDLLDKERYEVIKLGVQNGVTNLDDIEKAYNEYAEGGHVFATKGNLTKDELNTERGIIIAQINENPELLFTPGYEQWREYYRRNGQLDNLWNQISFDKQLAIFQNNPKSITALSNKAQADFGAARTREKTNEAAPQVIGGMAAAVEAPLMMTPIGLAVNTAINGAITGYSAYKNNWNLKKTFEDESSTGNKAERALGWMGNNFLAFTPENMKDYRQLGTQISYNNKVNDLNNNTLTPQNIEAVRKSEAGYDKNGNYRAIDKNGNFSIYPNIMVTKDDEGNNIRYNMTANGGFAFYDDNNNIIKYVDSSGNEINPTLDANKNGVPSFVQNTLLGSRVYKPDIITPEQRHKMNIEQRIINENATKAYNSMNIKPGTINERINDATNEINQARVKTHNEIAPVINANDNAAAERAATSQTTPLVATTTPSTTTDTRVKVRTPQQTITQAPQLIQQQAVAQKPNKMQGFMNKLGAAFPYIGDFVGWTLGDSRFFNYGGNIYADGGDLSDEEKKQLEWSKKWHTERANYMPWTDEQKAAYLKAIDKTYSDNNFTRSISKPMGFYHKDGSININYDNANNTIYGDMAERSGLVHEIAHKLSFNANQEFNKIDNTIPEQEAATLRAKKLGKFVNPLEVGGVMNTRKFVDYNTDDKTARQQEKEFRNSGVYRYKNTPVDKYGHNAVEVKAKLDEARYRLNLHPSQMDIKPESVEMWRGRGLFPSSLEDYSNEEIANMLNTFAYNNNNNYSYENQS